MATYSLSPATPAWQTLPAPTADAYLQPVGGNIYVSEDATPNKATAIIVSNLDAYPVSSGNAVKVACVGSAPVPIRMADKS